MRTFVPVLFSILVVFLNASDSSSIKNCFSGSPSVPSIRKTVRTPYNSDVVLFETAQVPHIGMPLPKTYLAAIMGSFMIGRVMTEDEILRPLLHIMENGELRRVKVNLNNSMAITRVEASERYIWKHFWKEWKYETHTATRPNVPEELIRGATWRPPPGYLEWPRTKK